MITLLQKQQTFARLVPKLLCKAFELGFSVTIGMAQRTEEEAERLGFKDSVHVLKCAIDLQLFNGEIYLRRTEDYQELGEYWESLSEPEKGIICRWGGRFKQKDGTPKPDGNHFSLEHLGRA